MNVATRTPGGALKRLPSTPVAVAPCAVSGVAATLADETIGFGTELTGPVEVTWMAVPATVVVPVLPVSVSVTPTVNVPPAV